MYKCIKKIKYGFEKLKHIFSDKADITLLKKPDETIIADSNIAERRRLSFLIRYGWARQYSGAYSELMYRLSRWIIDKKSCDLTLLDIMTIKRLLIKELQAEKPGKIGYHYISAILNDLDKELSIREDYRDG